MAALSHSVAPDRSVQALSARIRVVFLIHSLEVGGAERQLATLARKLDPTRFAVTVVTFYDGGRLTEELLQRGDAVRVVSAAKRGRRDLLGFLWRLWKLVSAECPHIVHGYMYGANELAWLLARAASARVVWGIRASRLELEHYGWRTRVLLWVGARLAHRVDAFIVNSEAGRRDCIRLNYPAARLHVIPNGIDTQYYHHDAAGRRSVRAQWRAGDDDVLIGIVARIDPMKDHQTFLHAACALVAAGVAARFVIVGEGAAEQFAPLRELAGSLRIDQHVIWAGPREDMPAVYSALDIATSSSVSEGFSNSTAEAMACETLCVVTDVGDARSIVADTGEVVPPRAPHELAAAWQRILRAPPAERAARRCQARARIVEMFEAHMLAARTGHMLTQLAAGRNAASMVR